MSLLLILLVIFLLGGFGVFHAGMISAEWLIIIVVLIILFGGGGWWRYGRRGPD
jgi:uncharacterized membrane protein YeiB